MRNTKTPRFQARHYEIIAKGLLDCRPAADQVMMTSQWRKQVAWFVSVFKADNPKFSSDRFYEASGY